MRGKSLMSDEDNPMCFICNTTLNLQVHHIFNGPNRTKSDEDGCWCYLCAYHHVDGNNSVHRNPERAMYLKRICQRKWEQRYEEEFPNSDYIEAFRKRYHKSYI